MMITLITFPVLTLITISGNHTDVQVRELMRLDPDTPIGIITATVGSNPDTPDTPIGILIVIVSYTPNNPKSPDYPDNSRWNTSGILDS